MENRSYVIHSLNDLPSFVSELLPLLSRSLVWCFYGEMGAGKTTLIREICRQLQVTDSVTSPTFALVNEYRRTGKKSVFHFDFYRIKDIREAYDLGYEEYFYGGSHCFVEWPEKVEEILPPGLARVRIARESNDTRQIVLEIPEQSI